MDKTKREIILSYLGLEWTNKDRLYVMDGNGDFKHIVIKITPDFTVSIIHGFSGDDSPVYIVIKNNEIILVADEHNIFGTKTPEIDILIEWYEKDTKEFTDYENEYWRHIPDEETDTVFTVNKDLEEELNS
jgi:hypothetical protein